MAEVGTKLSTQQRIQKVRDGFAAFQRGDLQYLNENIADDAVWHVPGTTRFSGDFRGKQQILQMLGGFAQSWDEMRSDIHDVLASDEHVGVLVNFTAKKNGKPYEEKQSVVFHLDPEGKAKEVWVIGDSEGVKKALEG